MSLQQRRLDRHESRCLRHPGLLPATLSCHHSLHCLQIEANADPALQQLLDQIKAKFGAASAAQQPVLAAPQGSEASAAVIDLTGDDQQVAKRQRTEQT